MPAWRDSQPAPISHAPHRRHGVCQTLKASSNGLCLNRRHETAPAAGAKSQAGCQYRKGSRGSLQLAVRPQSPRPQAIVCALRGEGRNQRSFPLRLDCTAAMPRPGSRSRTPEGRRGDVAEIPSPTELASDDEVLALGCAGDAGTVPRVGAASSAKSGPSTRGAAGGGSDLGVHGAPGGRAAASTGRGPGPSGGNVEPLAGAASTGGSGTISCWFCARHMTVTAAINRGCRTYPRYACRACHNSAKALDRAATSKGKSAVDLFSRLKRVKPEQYRADVLKFRVSVPGEAPAPTMELAVSEKTPASVGERQDKVREYLECLEMQQGVTETERVLFLTERQFKAYYVTFEGYSKDEAALHWTTCLDNEKVSRRTRADGATTLAVETPLAMDLWKTTVRKRTLEERPVVDDEAQESMLKRLKTFLPPEQMSEVLELFGGGSAFAGGAARGVPDMPKPAGLRLSAGNLGRLGSSTGSEASSVDGSRRSGASLVQRRREVLNSVKAFLANQHRKKAATYRALTDMVQKLGCDHTEVVQTGATADLAAFEASVVKLQGPWAGGKAISLQWCGCRLQSAGSLRVGIASPGRVVCEARNLLIFGGITLHILFCK